MNVQEVVIFTEEGEEILLTNRQATFSLDIIKPLRYAVGESPDLSLLQDDEYYYLRLEMNLGPMVKHKLQAYRGYSSSKFLKPMVRFKDENDVWYCENVEQESGWTTDEPIQFKIAKKSESLLVPESSPTSE